MAVLTALTSEWLRRILLLIQNGCLTNKSSLNYNKSVLLRIKQKYSRYLPLWGRWISEGSSAEHRLWMRRGPLWTPYSVHSLHLFGFVWWTSDVLDPSDHPLYLGPGPTQPPTPTPGVRKISHEGKNTGNEWERNGENTNWTFHCLHRHVDVLILHLTV